MVMWAWAGCRQWCGQCDVQELRVAVRSVIPQTCIVHVHIRCATHVSNMHWTTLTTGALWLACRRVTSCYEEVCYSCPLSTPGSHGKGLDNAREGLTPSEPANYGSSVPATCVESSQASNQQAHIPSQPQHAWAWQCRMFYCCTAACRCARTAP